MTTQNKEMVIGDVVKWELPHELARTKVHITNIPGASVGLVVGEILEPGGAVAQVHTFAAIASAPLADGGTYKLGYKGQWTTAMAWNETLGNAKTAFEALSTVTDTITFSAEPCITGSTGTWATAGKKAKINVDARLLLDGALDMDGSTFPVTTGGSVAASSAKIIATGANADYILLEKVTLTDLQTELNIMRTVISKGDCIVDGDNLFALAAELAGSKAALVTRGITIRTEPTLYQSGIPTS
ncbi:hypothetical protein LCGC14_1310800 [marine sediment metagenome]|uniref:Uncharacterized protein n=1 Tax=marine sediment metagenome TaxID=412755 RepID=A0A0F9N3P4_9ZZZZ